MPGIDENTLLLLHGEELIDSSQYEKTFTGNNVVISTEQSKFGGKSLYFNGTNAYITLPVYNDMMFGGNDFTIDWWEYRTRTNGSIFNLNHTSGGFGLLCTHLDGTKIYTSSYGATWDMFSGENAFSPTINQWTHWALVKNGNTWRTFKNGVKFWETTNTSSLNTANVTGSTIGRQVPGSDYFQGYIDEFRVSNVARWTEDFTPPDEAYTVSNLIEYTFTNLKNNVEYFARVYPMNLKGYAQSEITGQVVSAMPREGDPNTLFLLHGEEFVDSSMYGKTFTNNNVVVSEEQSKFGGKSLFFNGKNAYLELPKYDDLMFGSGDFTIDWWEYRQNTKTLLWFNSGSSYYSHLLLFEGKFLFCATNVETNAWDAFANESVFEPIVNQWMHLAIVRNGSTWRTYRNGKKFWESNKTIVFLPDGITKSRIGFYHDAYFKGYIDEFRISNVARWTSNFTPPTEPYK